MLSDLIKLGKAKLSLTTNTNGQVNLAIFKEGASTPLAITFDPNNTYEVEQEIRSYCNQLQMIDITTNLTDLTAKNTKTDTKATKAPELSTQKVVEPETAEDALLAEFNL